MQSPSSPSQWVVLANYIATEPGMLSVNEGEFVQVMDTSPNDWCLARSMSRPSMEGWVPSAYLSPYVGVAGGFHPPSPRYPSFSSSEESDTPTEVLDHTSILSPELLETCDDEEQRAVAVEKRRYYK